MPVLECRIVVFCDSGDRDSSGHSHRAVRFAIIRIAIVRSGERTHQSAIEKYFVRSAAIENRASEYVVVVEHCAGNDVVKIVPPHPANSVSFIHGQIVRAVNVVNDVNGSRLLRMSSRNAYRQR